MAQCSGIATGIPISSCFAWIRMRRHREAPRGTEVRRLPAPPLFRLDLFGVLHQIIDADVADIRVRPHVPEEVAPHRHILRPMRHRHVGFTINDEADVPVAHGSASPLMMCCTWSSGNLPPFFLEICVKSEGGTFSALAAGPSPLPVVPWQTAQYSRYRSLPATDVVGCTGTFFTVVGACCAWAAPMPRPIGSKPRMRLTDAIKDFMPI